MPPLLPSSATTSVPASTRRVLAVGVLASLFVGCPLGAFADGSASGSSSSNGSSFQPSAPADQDFNAGLSGAWRTSGILRGNADQYVELAAGDTLQYSFKAVSSGVFSFSFAYAAWNSWHEGGGDSDKDHRQYSLPAPALLGADAFDISITPGSFLGGLTKQGGDDRDHGNDAASSGSGHGTYTSLRNPGGGIGQVLAYSSPALLQAGQNYLLAIQLKTPAQPTGGPYGGNRGNGQGSNDDDGSHDRPLHVGVDDFRVGTLAVVSNVPEAHGWALYTAGLLTLAWLGRRRRRGARSRLQAGGVPQGRC